MRLRHITSCGQELELELKGQDTVVLHLNGKSWFAEHLISKAPVFLPFSAYEFLGAGNALQKTLHLADVIPEGEWKSFSERILGPLGVAQGKGRKAAIAKSIEVNREASARGELSPFMKVKITQRETGKYHVEIPHDF